MAQRILAICSALLLVSAFALATLVSPDMSLRMALYALDDTFVPALHASIEGHLSAWAWDHIFLPVLVRPVWLVPAMLGVICAGAAVTLPIRGEPRRSPRRGN